MSSYTQNNQCSVYRNEVSMSTFTTSSIGMLLGGISVAFLHGMGKTLAEINLYSAPYHGCNYKPQIEEISGRLDHSFQTDGYLTRLPKVQHCSVLPIQSFLWERAPEIESSGLTRQSTQVLLFTESISSRLAFWGNWRGHVELVGILQILSSMCF